MIDVRDQRDGVEGCVVKRERQRRVDDLGCLQAGIEMKVDPGRVLLEKLVAENVPRSATHIQNPSAAESLDVNHPLIPEAQQAIGTLVRIEHESSIRKG